MFKVCTHSFVNEIRKGDMHGVNNESTWPVLVSNNMQKTNGWWISGAWKTAIFCFLGTTHIFDKISGCC